jgi:hypothetical protein
VRECTNNVKCIFARPDNPQDIRVSHVLFFFSYLTKVTKHFNLQLTLTGVGETGP